MARRGIWLGLGLAALALLGGYVALAHLGVRILIADPVPVQLLGALPFRARIAEPMAVAIDGEVTAKVSLDSLEIPLRETIQVPLDLSIDVPIDTEIAVSQDMDLSLTVPISTVLTEREFDLSKLEVPIDTEVFIDDEIAVDFVLPVKTEVTTLLGVKVPVEAKVPIKARVPIRQKVRVRDTLVLGVRKLRVPLKMSLPVRAKFPLSQSFHVKGRVKAPVRQTVAVPIDQTIRPRLEALSARVQLDGQVPARLQGELSASVQLDEPVQAKLAPLHIDASDVTLETR